MYSALIILLLVGLSFYGWCYIHEMSHVLMAKKRLGLEWYKLKLYPHMSEGSLRWAACEYMPKKAPTPEDTALIALAPRLPNLLAAWLFILTPAFSGWLAVCWFIFFGAGLVDLMNGSIGLSPGSDLQKAANTGVTKMSANGLRILGFTFALSSIALTLLSYLMRH